MTIQNSLSYHYHDKLLIIYSNQNHACKNSLTTIYVVFTILNFRVVELRLAFNSTSGINKLVLWQRSTHMSTYVLYREAVLCKVIDE